jgi:DNA-binding transcriptional MerR regulator
MPKERKVLNGFTASDVHKHTKLSVHMIDYLARENYLQPSYGIGRLRGKVRYYSYRDLVIAKIIQEFRECGIELRRIKEAIQELRDDRSWFPKDGRSFDVIRTDGTRLYFHDEDEQLTELTSGRQRAFAFIINVRKTKKEIQEKIGVAKRRRFTMENRPLKFEERPPAKSRGYKNTGTTATKKKPQALKQGKAKL